MLKLRSSSRSRPEPLFIAAAEHEKPFFERNFTKYFGEETTWEEAIHGETGESGFMVFAKLSKKTKSDLVARLREAARTASYSATHSPSPSPRLSPRVHTQHTPNLSPLPSPRHLSPLPSPRPTVNTTSPLPSPRVSTFSPLPSPRVSNFSPLPLPRYEAPLPPTPCEHPQRPQLRIQKPDDEPIYEPQLVQCGGLSPHHDAFNFHSPTSRASNNLSSPIQARQTRSMPSSPVGYTYPSTSTPSASASAQNLQQQEQQPRHPPGRTHQHSQSAHLSASDIAGIIDVTNFWDPSSLQPFPPSPQPRHPKPPHHRPTNSDTTTITTAGIRPVIESGLGLEEFYDIYAATIAEEEARLAEQERRERRKRELEQQGREEAEEAEDVVVRMSANFMGQDIVPDLMIQRRDTEEWRIRPPPKTRRELLRLGWVREKGDLRGEWRG
ncbi:hypothetical protein EX30DRAFT_371443 [Ascodesmis nigricans]|uniref:Uncharacterized protein n=1 Tax=Ascodesmis nigricans TaxID=341454 RepID=A0A4S2MXM4_9PEZI|nr:hypothetical protein EX30DRAFT_371443 [Ascodesmis nigricans]